MSKTIDEILETMACQDCTGYPIKAHDRAKQAIADMIAESYTKGYIEGGIDTINRGAK